MHHKTTNAIPTLLVGFILLILFTACTDTRPINLQTDKGHFNEDLEYGVSMRPPQNFKKAKSYVGFQAPRQAGSIELVMEDDYQELVNKYSPETMKLRNSKLDKHQPVAYGENENAFYVEYFDKPQKRYRQALVIAQNEKVYHIKSFYRGPLVEFQTQEIRDAILSTHIGEFREGGKPFSNIFLADLNTDKIIYTRDNKYPTEEPDSLVVSVENVDNLKLKGMEPKAYIKKRVAEYGPKIEYVLRDPLDNGYILKCTNRSDSLNVLGILMVSEEENHMYIECVGNKKVDLKEVGNIMISQFVTM